MRLLLLLLLSGCAPSIDSLYLERAYCLQSGGQCDDLQVKIERRERMIEMRENARTPCPPNMVAYCERVRDKGCGRRYSPEPVEYVCVSADQMRIFY